MSNVKLQLRIYSEKTLVNLICTAAQKREYERRGKFPNAQKRNMFLDRLSRYCEYDYLPDSKKYQIIRVFNTPITDAEIRIHKGIYQYLAPLILDKVISNTESRHSIVTSYDLARDSYLVNSNYGYMKSRQDVVERDIKIPKSTLFEFFTNTDSRIDDYVERCVKYLAVMNCIFYDQIHIVAVDAELNVEGDGETIRAERKINRHKASQAELEQYAVIVDKASIEAGVVNATDRWYGKTGVRYKAALDEALKAERIEYMVKGFELYRINLDRCNKILQTFNDKTLEERRKEIGAVFKLIIDSNAEKRADARPRADKNFIENFKNLSEITLLYDADDIRPQMPSAKSYRQIMNDKARNILIDYRESIITS